MQGGSWADGCDPGAAQPEWGVDTLGHFGAEGDEAPVLLWVGHHPLAQVTEYVCGPGV